jgi:RNA polymerase sigma-70 factor (ECF subfamily)
MSTSFSVKTKLKRPDQNEEENLVKSARKGDLDAFNQLVLKYQDLAYNHANVLLRDSFLAEDATQEGFIKAFQNINSFRGGSFRAWLMRIVTNTVYDILRKSKRQPTQPLFPENENGEEIESISWLADPNASVQETVELREFASEIYQILDELPEIYRSVLTLINIYEMDYTEVAQSLNIPLGTVKSRITRARLRMMDRVNDKSSHIYRPSNTKTDVATTICSN